MIPGSGMLTNEMLTELKKRYIAILRIPRLTLQDPTLEVYLAKDNVPVVFYESVNLQFMVFSNPIKDVLFRYWRDNGGNLPNYFRLALPLCHGVEDIGDIARVQGGHWTSAVIEFENINYGQLTTLNNQQVATDESGRISSHAAESLSFSGLYEKVTVKHMDSCGGNIPQEIIRALEELGFVSSNNITELKIPVVRQGDWYTCGDCAINNMIHLSLSDFVANHYNSSYLRDVHARGDILITRYLRDTYHLHGGIPILPIPEDQPPIPSQEALPVAEPDSLEGEFENLSIWVCNAAIIDAARHELVELSLPDYSDPVSNCFSSLLLNNTPT